MEEGRTVLGINILIRNINAGRKTRQYCSLTFWSAVLTEITPLRLERSLRQPPRNLVCNEIEGKLSYTPFWKCTVCALCRYPSYILMITVYAVRRYPSQVGSLVWLRIAQPKMSRFGAILNNQPSGNRKSHHHHHYHPNISLSAWAPSRWLQGQFWKWCNSGNKNCKKAFTQSALSKVGPIAFYKKSSGK